MVDAIDDTDLMQIGRAVAGARLVTGGSGIALGLARNFPGAGRSDAAVGRANDGPGAILAGSCSGMTRRQIEAHRRDHPALEVDVEAVMEGRLGADDVAAFLLDHPGCAPLAFSSGDPVQVAAMQARYGREAVAARLDALFGDVARRLVASGIGRLVVAGGETSGAVVSALGIGALEIGAEIAPGVPVLTSAAGLALALKSGNFGDEDFFVRALDVMKGKT